MGDGIRARHRNETTPVWAVYTLAKGVDESTGGTSGSVTLSSSRYKMAASAYTVSSSGTISLTNATQKTAANIAVGDYLINVGTSSNTATTGTTLYKVTAVSGTSSIKISYIAYSVGNVRGVDTGERVESDTMEYPVNGIQGEYWYVLIRGYATIHVWDIYNVKTTHLYKELTYTNSAYLQAKMYTNTYIYYSSSYTFDKNTGRYYLNNPTQLSSLTSTSTLSSKYWVVSSSYSDNSGYSDMYYGCTAVDWDGYGKSGYVTGTKRYTYEKDTNSTVYSQGTATGKTAKSAGSTFYPQNGEYSGYWYVYSHSYTGYIDMT